MKQRVRVQKAADTTVAGVAPVNRLTGMEVEEVSIVDRAANQRKYLVVKEGAAPPPPPAAAAAPPPAAPPAPPPAAIQVSPELKAKVLTVLSAAQAKMAVVAKQLETATETPGAAAPKELMDQLTAIGSMFATGAAPAPAPVAAPAPAPGVPPPAAKEETTKAGKKVSAARLAQLLSVKTTLDTLIADVSDGNDDEAEPDETAPTKKNDAGEPVVTPVAASSEFDGIKASIQSLADVVGKMTLVFEGQNARIDSLTKSHGKSQQVDLDKQPTNKSAKPVVWDLDMAKPLKVVQ